ncbi:hypothetical protein OG331_49530 [Streptomyces sp. NBC_01017]|uniref:hypothetical protein n=1 Tax=Streptomyces sp. NBC_01017 TaxID=2903721 RepID=UPI0038697874|nr:hypothetical protein OG331_02445 [Streptomyces sp. NBC_01017]WSV35031.1 hypothetical protein OG331_49530 [Streptomyces sp. NBC_01017]
MMKRYVTAVLAAAAVLTGISAPAASADSPGISTPRQSATGRQLNNLMWTPTLSMSGTTIWMLRMQEEPAVEPGGVYFLWNPDTASPAGRFSVGDDVQVSTVSSWRGAIFSPDLAAQHIEVRYGNVTKPEEAAVVASSTTCPPHLTC